MGDLYRVCGEVEYDWNDRSYRVTYWVDQQVIDVMVTVERMADLTVH